SIRLQLVNNVIAGFDEFRRVRWPGTELQLFLYVSHGAFAIERRWNWSRTWTRRTDGYDIRLVAWRQFLPRAATEQWDNAKQRERYECLGLGAQASSPASRPTLNRWVSEVGEDACAPGNSVL